MLKTMLALFSLASGSQEKEREPGYEGVIIFRNYTVEALFVPFWTPASVVCPICSTQFSSAPPSVTLFSQEQLVTFFSSFFAQRQGLISTKIWRTPFFEKRSCYARNGVKEAFLDPKSNTFGLFFNFIHIMCLKSLPDGKHSEVGKSDSLGFLLCQIRENGVFLGPRINSF